MPGRQFYSDGRYRYGFNGKENDIETTSSSGGTQDYGFRIYNPSLCRFLSVDPLTKSYPMLTPYQFASNRPISSVDLDGLESADVYYYQVDGKYTGDTEIKLRDKNGPAGDGIQVHTMIMSQGADGTSVYTEDLSKSVYEGATTTVNALSKETEQKVNDILTGKYILDAAERTFNGLLGDSYGEGEHYIKSAKLGAKGKFGVGGGAAGFDINIYSSSENSAGISLELYTEESVSRVVNKNGGKGLNVESFLPKAELEGYISGSTGDIPQEIKEGGIYTENKTVATLKTTATSGLVNGYVESEVNLKTGKSKSTGTLSIGKTGSPGVKGEVKQKQSVTFSSGEGDL